MRYFALSAPLFAATQAAVSTLTTNVLDTAPWDITDTKIKEAIDSVTLADTAAADAFSAISGLTDAQLKDCIINTDNPIFWLGTISNTNVESGISDLFFQYAAGYWNESFFDTQLANLKACMVANSLAEATANKLTVDAKNAIVQYGARPSFDWAGAAAVYNEAGSPTELTTAQFSTTQQQYFFRYVWIGIANMVNQKYPISADSVPTELNFAGNTWATIDTDTTTFENNADFEKYLTIQMKLKALGESTEKFTAVVENLDTLASEWFSDATAMQEFKDVVTNKNSQFTDWKTKTDAQYDFYHSRNEYSPYYQTAIANKSFSGDALTAYESINSALNNNKLTHPAHGYFLSAFKDATCKNAVANEVKYTEGYSTATITLNQKMQDLYFLYAMRYIDSTHFDKEITSLKDCLDASTLSSTEISDMKSSLDTAKNAITQFTTGMIDVDFSLLTGSTNTETPAERELTISSTLGRSWYTAELIKIADDAATYVSFPTVDANNFDADSLPSALSAFDTESKLTSEHTKQLRAYALQGSDADFTSTWEANFYDNRAAIAASYGLTGSDADSFTADMVNLKSNLDAIKTLFTNSNTAYQVVETTNEVVTAGLSSDYQQVHTNNAAKFVESTDANAAASYASVLVAITAATDAIDYVNNLTGTDLDNCRAAMYTVFGFDIDVNGNTMPDMLYLYAFKYVTETKLNELVTAYTSCINVKNPSNAAALTTAMATAKTAIVQYPGQIDIDWTYVNTQANLPTTTAVSLTSDELKSVYTSFKIYYTGLASLTAYNDLTTAQQTVIVTQSDLAETLTNINALNTNDPTFNSITDYSNYASIEIKEYALGKTSDYVSNFVNQASAIADAYGLTGTDKTAFESMSSSTKTLLDTAVADIDTQEAGYNAGEKLGSSLLVVLLAKYLF